jgi:peroxidase
MQNELFKINYPDGSIHAVDLLATNLNRGRDHGIPPYTKYLEYCLGRNATRFNDIRDLITVGRLVTLSSVYEYT